MALVTTLQIGTYNAVSDTFLLVLDLNDHVTYFTQMVDDAQPPREWVDSSNIRTRGAPVFADQYDNRQVRAQLYIQASGSAIYTAIHNLYSALEHPRKNPYVLKIQKVNATQPIYYVVEKIAHSEPYNALHTLQGFSLNISLTWECLPLGFSIPRLTHHNLAVNPGFTVGIGGALAPAVVAFADAFANVNAYAVQAGSAPTTGPANTYVDIIKADMPLVYYRLGESSGSSAYDIGGNYATGTYQASPTLGVAGAISGDTDTAVTLNGTTQYVSLPTTNLPTGSAAFTLEAWVKITANPTTNNRAVLFMGSTGGAGNGAALGINTSGQANSFLWSGTTITAAAALTLSAWHHLAFTYVGGAGGTLTLYVDGASAGTTTGTGTLTYSGGAADIGNSPSASFTFLPGSVDEAAIYNVALTGTQILNHYNAGHSGATGTLANALSIPSGSRVAFGSPNWGAIQTWQARFRFVTGLTADFYPHYTDANNFLKVKIAAGQFAFTDTIAGVSTTLQFIAQTFTHEAWYWLQITQFPMQAGTTPYVQAVLLSDNDGSPGAVIATLGPVVTTDAATNLSGRPQIDASGATLELGGLGNSAGAGQQVSLFGPGGWIFQGQLGSATGQASGAWEQTNANCLPLNTAAVGATPNGGPITSVGAARFDAPPAGTFDAAWRLWAGAGSVATSWAAPVFAAGNQLGLAGWVRSSGLSGTAVTQITISEFASTGTFLRQGTVASVNGNISAWTAWSGTYTTGANCAYVDMKLETLDTTAGASANATVWHDNVQIWNITTTNQTTMPYCETRFPGSPAQITLTGIQGDVSTPTLISFGTYLASWPTSGTLTFQTGLASGADPNKTLIWDTRTIFLGAGIAPVLDSGSYSGWYIRSPASSSSYATSALSVQPSTLSGIYDVLARIWNSQSVGNLPNVTIRPHVTQGVLQGTSVNQGTLDGASVAPLSASSTWTLANIGQVQYPISSPGVTSDYTQFYSQTYGQLADTTGGGSTFQVNVNALLPVDTQLVIIQAINPTNNSAVTTQWLWTYTDGLGLNLQTLQVGVGYSLEAGSQPLPSHSGGGQGNFTSGPVNVNPNSDATIYLDPTVKTSTGYYLNQLLASVTDQSGTVLPTIVEFTYQPLWLNDK